MAHWVTIRTAVHPADISSLGMMQAYLESYDIECFIKGEHSMSTSAHARVGGELQVMESDVDRTISLLIEGGFATKEDYEGLPVPQWVLNLHERFRRIFKKQKKEDYL